MTLSFQVVEIIERMLPHVADPTPVKYTVLKRYGNDDRITILGAPWPVGAKVDFQEMEQPCPMKP